jgi:hypothetical protein
MVVKDMTVRDKAPDEFLNEIASDVLMRWW